MSNQNNFPRQIYNYKGKTTLSNQRYHEETDLFSKSNKQTQIQDKIKRKLEEDIQHCIQLILDKKVAKSTQILKNIILESYPFHQYPFKGQGNNQNWEGCFSKGPFQWFSYVQQNEENFLNPFDLLSFCYMVDLSEKATNISQVVSSYKELSSHLPECYEIYIGLGNAFYNSHQFLNAEQNYLKSLQIKSSQKAYEYLAWIKGVQFQLRQAAPFFCRKCLEFNPQNRACLFILALCQKQIEQRKNNLQKIINNHPDFCRAIVSIGDCETNLQERLHFYDKAIKLDPNYVSAYVSKGLALIEKNPQETKKILKKLSSLSLHSFKMYEAIGTLEDKLENKDEALKNYRKSLELNPWNWRIIKSLAIISSSVNIHLSINYYKKLIKINPYDCQTFYSLGKALEKIDKNISSVQQYKKALQVNPNHFESLCQLASLYYKRKQFQDSLTYYQKAFNAKLNDANVCYEIACCFEKLNKLDEVEKWALICAQKGGDQQKQVYKLLAFLYKGKNCYAQSLRWFLASSSALEQFNSDEIKMSLLSNMTKQEAIQAIWTNFTNIKLEKQNIFAFLDIGALLFYLEDYEKALKSFEMAKLISQQEQLPRNAYFRLLRVFGANQYGTVFEVGKCKHVILQRQYEILFEKNYGLNE